MSDTSPLAKVEQFGRRHRNALLAAGAAGVGGLALLMRHRGGPAADSGPTPTNASPVGQPSDPYSSVAYDVYDALQPQLEQATGQLQSEIDSANERIAALGKKTTADKRKHQPRPHPGTQRSEHPKHKTAKASPKKPVKSSRRKTGKVSQPKPANPNRPKPPAARKITRARKATPVNPRRG